ncbi:MAG: hypothetical protein ABIS35_07590, partial [Terracoccus sp.]
LPIDHALSRVPAVRALVQSLADRAAALRGRSVRPVPDLGPAVLMDQLVVVLHDLFEADPDADAPAVSLELSGIRRSL